MKPCAIGARRTETRGATLVARLLAPTAALALLFLNACERSSESNSPETASSGSKDRSPGEKELGFAFHEISAELGIEFRHTDGSSGRYSIVETLASGLALFDFDLDGDLDIYFLNGRPLFGPEGSPPPRNALYRNDGDRFVDVTEAMKAPGVGYSVGCAAGDYDNDGDLDLYVTGLGSNVLYRNDGRYFTDVTTSAGVDETRFSAGAVFFDMDRDDDLDLYVTNYCDPELESSRPCPTNGYPSYCAPGSHPAAHDTLFENLGDGTFADISEKAGIRPTPRWGMGVVALDYDDDGWLDIYVANDVSDNFLFRNRGDKTFENVALTLGVALGSEGLEQGSMGVDAGDFNGDGRFDIFVTNYQKQLNALYRHDGSIGFSDVAMITGLGKGVYPNVGWGTAFIDVDHDGWRDLFVANGHLDDHIDQFDQSSTYLQRNQIFLNERGRFREVTSKAGPGLAERLSSRGAAFGDIDLDGDIDIVVSNSRDRPSVLRNDGANRRSWILLDLRGKKNRFAVGAKVTLEAGGHRQIAEVRSGASYVSQSDFRLHFGLGDAERVDRVTVRWPNGRVSTHESLEARRIHRIEEP